MSSLTKMPAWLVWTLCVAILLSRVGGMHLHLCFDGQQSPVSILAGQAGSDEFQVTHQDKDISLVGDALVKNLDSAALLPVLLVAAVLLFILGATRTAGFPSNFSSPHFPSLHGFYLRPPLRGPPR